MNFVQVFIWTFEQMNMNNFFCSNVHLNFWTNEHEQGLFWTCSEQMNMNTLFLSVFRTNEHEHAYFWTCSEQMNMNTLFLNVFSAHPCGLDLLSGKRQQDPTSLRLVEWIISEGCRNYGYGLAFRAGVSTSCVSIDGRDSTSLYVGITVIAFNYLHQNRLLRSLQDLWSSESGVQSQVNFVRFGINNRTG